MIQSRILYSTSEISSTLAISKYRGEKGEKETAEIEKIHTEAWGWTLERILSSQRKAILLLSHVAEQTVQTMLFFQQETQRASKDNFQRSPTRQSRMLYRNQQNGPHVWPAGGFLPIAIIKNLWNDIVDNCCLGATSSCPPFRSIWAYYHWQASIERQGTLVYVTPY